MKSIDFTFDTVPGVTDYTSGATSMHAALFIIIATEGSNEEIEYIKYVQSLLREKSVSSFEIVFLNDYISDDKIRVGASNPHQRLDMMLDWKHRQLSVVGTDVVDEDWLICDRDDGSFTEQQYGQVMQIAQHNNINVIVSNPAFQLWLLFHFTGNINGLHLDSLATSRERLDVVENELISHISDYQHGSIDMTKFARYISDAINNSQNYPMEPDDLKTMSGSNFANLLLDIQMKAGLELYE